MSDYNVENFTYYSIEDGQEDILKLTNFQNQYTWWTGICRGDNIPYKHDIEFHDLRGWHSDILLSKLIDNNLDVEYRIIGENVKIIFGDDIKQGSFTSHIKNIPKETRLEDLRIMSSGRFISHFNSCVPIEGQQYIEVETLRLPFSDKDGKCSHFVTFFRKSKQFDD